MIVFWILAALMLVAALLMVIPPLLKSGRQTRAAREALNVRIYQDQLAELQADLGNTTLSAEQFEQSRRDLERNLLVDVADATAPRSTAAGLGGRTAIGLLVAVPLLAVALYLQLGKINEAVAPQIAAENPHPQNEMAAEGAEADGFTPEMMVRRLDEHLKTQPDDGAGWEMLGRSYRVMNRFPEASAAYAKAIALLGENAQRLADYADVLALASPAQSLAGKPSQLIARSLKLDSANPRALWLAGMAAYQEQDFRGAGDYWTRLAKAVPEGTEDARVIRQSINEAQARAAMPAELPK